MISKIIMGLKSGELWYLRVSIYIQIFSTLLYIRAANKEYDIIEQQRKDVVFAGRMIIASIAMVIISLLLAIGTKTIVVLFGTVVYITALILMLKIESLPIWEEEGRE